MTLEGRIRVRQNNDSSSSDSGGGGRFQPRGSMHGRCRDYALPRGVEQALRAGESQ